MPTATRTTERPAAPATTERILDAAERCLERFGLRRASMADIAAQAGLSRGALYLHFADRQSLIDAVLERAAIRFVDSAEAEVRHQPTLAAQAGAAAAFIRRNLGGQLDTLRLPAEQESLVAVLLTAASGRLVDRWIEFWQPLLAEAAERGELRPDLDRRGAAEWIVRLMLSFAVLGPVTFCDEPAEVHRYVAGLVVAGLGPGAGGAATRAARREGGRR